MFSYFTHLLYLLTLLALLTLLTDPFQNCFWYQVCPLEKRTTELQSSDRRSEIGDRRSSLVDPCSESLNPIMLTYVTYLPVSERFLVPSRSAREKSNRATEQRSSLGSWRSAVVARGLASCSCSFSCSCSYSCSCSCSCSCSLRLLVARRSFARGLPLARRSEVVGGFIYFDTLQLEDIPCFFVAKSSMKA